MTAKDTRGPAAYDGTAALKMDAPAAPTKPRWRLPRRKPTEKIEKSAKREKPPAPPQAAGSGAAGWLARTGRWTIPGAILALVVVTLVIVVTLASYAKLVMVNDQVVELRDSLSQLQSEETQLAAQYELAYDLQAIEQQLLASGEMMQIQPWQSYTLELAEPDSVEYYQGTNVLQQVTSFFQGLATAVREYF